MGRGKLTSTKQDIVARNEALILKAEMDPGAARSLVKILWSDGDENSGSGSCTEEDENDGSDTDIRDDEDHEDKLKDTE